jgi:hypothetical protein
MIRNFYKWWRQRIIWNLMLKFCCESQCDVRKLYTLKNNWQFWFSFWQFLDLTAKFSIRQFWPLYDFFCKSSIYTRGGQPAAQNGIFAAQSWFEIRWFFDILSVFPQILWKFGPKSQYFCKFSRMRPRDRFGLATPDLYS